MADTNSRGDPGKRSLVFLHPEVYQPLKTNFSRKFVCLSERCSGWIFTLCSAQYRSLAIGDFQLFSERRPARFTSGLLTGFWIQALFPLWVLRGHPKPDAVVVYDPYISGLAGLVLKMALRTKLIVEVNGEFHKWRDPADNTFKHGLKAIICRVCMWSADGIKVLNSDQEGFWRQQYSTKRLYRFPNLVAGEYLSAKERYQGDYLLSVGYPFYRKGIDVLLKAFHLAAKKHRTARLKIMGYCPTEELGKYKELAGNDPKIEFLEAGWIEDVAEQIRGCYAFVHAARSEAMGRVLLEAMACAKPVVSTRTNGGNECVLDGRTGLLSKIEDSEDLAEKLDYLLSNPGVARQMGESGLERYRSEFSEEKYFSRFISMVEDVARDGQVNLGHDKR